MKIRTLFLSAIALLVAGTAQAQQRRITGRVTAEEGGAPLGAATVSLAGTTTGTFTTEDGRFSISAPATTVTLRIRRLGYQQRNVIVQGGQNDVTVAMVRDVLQLEAQVITGTATVVSSLNAANAVAVVSGEQLTRVAAPTVDNALQGKVAGAIISSNSGAPGGGTQVQLRGVSTINGTYSPLYVVDGVIVNNSTINSGLNVISGASRGNFSSSQDQSVNRIADLNPNDIENIQILKGPSASSIYGSKGTNGVIIITTKQGRAGRTAINFTQRVGRSTLANKLGSRCFQSGAEYADFAAAQLGQNKTEAAAEYNAAAIKCHDYEEEFYSNDGTAYETIASLSGGNASGTNYFVSGLAKHDNGLAPTDFYNKQSLRVNVGQTIGSRFTIGANSELLHTLTQRGLGGNDNNGTSPGAIFAATPSFYELRRNADGSFPKNPSQALGTGSNPFQNADLIKTPNNTYRFIGSLTNNLSLVSSEQQTLDARLTGGVDTYASSDRIVSPATAFTEQSSFGALAGTLFNSDGNIFNSNINGSLVHRFVASIATAQTSVGFRQERRELTITQLTGRGVIFPTVTNVSAAAQTFPNQTLGLTKDFAYFAQEELFAFSERLLLTAGVNAERSSNNGDQRKFYSYPKFSASYRVTTLPRFVNDFKARLAYGKAGNQPTAGRTTFLTSLLYEAATGTRASIVKGAEDIRPELATETEGGFDATLFNSRVRFSATAYKKQITDLLLTAPIVPSTGFTTQYLNGGQITNRGTELELDVTAYERGTASWISNVTFSKLKGFVDKLPLGVAPFNPGVGSFGRYGNAFIQEGQPTSIIQASVGCSVALSATGSCPAAGRILGFAGDANPDFNLGFNNTISVGGLRLSGLVEWRKGGDVVNLTNNYFDAINIAKDTLASQARLASYNAAGAPYVENAGFVKLREITVGYELPASLTHSLLSGRAQNVRLELSGRNLKTWTNYTGLDPEVSNFGNQALGRFQDVTPYPPSRTFFFSLVSSF
ncbi:MAG: SusC/RagA family TonB-linked outer membrane protein [Gemmatimonadaceae bacterium]|nr:SusC/RagA family TonB-linked outer membrane protein [Gemmatimonadaceae bacterium]